MHHTVAIGVKSPCDSGVITTSVFTFGWGEHGRLGLGDEEQQNTPKEVNFALSLDSATSTFTALNVSAGEQHTLVSGLINASAGNMINSDNPSNSNCFSFGSNSFGQLGFSSPSITEMALLPVKVSPYNSIILC